MKRYALFAIGLLSSGCAQHDPKAAEREALRIQGSICALKTLSEIERELSSEGFVLSDKGNSLVGVKEIKNQGVSIVKISIVASVEKLPNGTPGLCFVTPLAMGT